MPRILNTHTHTHTHTHTKYFEVDEYLYYLGGGDGIVDVCNDQAYQNAYIKSM